MVAQLYVTERMRAPFTLRSWCQTGPFTIFRVDIGGIVLVKALDNGQFQVGEIPYNATAFKSHHYLNRDGNEHGPPAWSYEEPDLGICDEEDLENRMLDAADIGITEEYGGE